MKFTFTALICFFSLPLFCQIPDCDIWLFDIKDSSGQISFHNPVNITSRKGYDNQPAFSPDSKYILFSSQREEAGQTDIYKYDITSKKIIPVTKTPTSEYSPTFMPDGKNISVVMVERDSSQRLWKFPLGKEAPVLIMPKVKKIGYHCWISKDSIALFILTKPDFTLQVANINTQQPTLITDSTGRCMHLLNGNLWFTKKRGRFNYVYEYSLKTKTQVPKGIIESEDYCFYKNQIWSCSDNTIVAGYMNSKTGASELLNLEPFGITKPTRIAVSPDGKKLAVVSNK